MTVENFIIITIVLSLTIGTPYISRFYLRNEPKITSEEIAQLRPDLGSIKTNYTIIMFGIAIIIMSTFVFTGAVIDKSDKWVLVLLIPLFAFITLFEGFFAMVTGVYSATTRSKWNRFVYDASNHLRWIARTQLWLASLEIVVGLAGFFWLRQFS
jgi:hypothetical protein